MKKISFAIILALLLANCSWQSKINLKMKRAGITFNSVENALKMEGYFEIWRRWKPIRFIMTTQEKKIVKKIRKMENLEKKELNAKKFIKYFWKRRDDNQHDGEKNDFKQRFYKRVIEAEKRFGSKESVTKRKCKGGQGWQTDMGLIYIVLGEPFHKARFDAEYLNMLLGRSYNSFLALQDIEVWYYEIGDDVEYIGSNIFPDGVVFVIFEREINFWCFANIDTIGLILYQEQQFSSRPRVPSSGAIGYWPQIYQFLKAKTESDIYDTDLEFKFEEVK